MADNEVISAILSATADKPADVAMQLSLWTNGQGQPPPPLEIKAKLYVADGPQVQKATYYVVGDYVNVRDAPAGAIVAKPVRGTQIDVDMLTVKDIPPNKWAKILTPAWAGNWVGINVLRPA